MTPVLPEQFNTSLRATRFEARLPMNLTQASVAP